MQKYTNTHCVLHKCRNTQQYTNTQQWQLFLIIDQCVCGTAANHGDCFSTHCCQHDQDLFSFSFNLGTKSPPKKRKLVLRAPLIQMPGYKLVKCQDYTKWIEYEANIYLQRSKDMQKNTDVAIFVYVYWPQYCHIIDIFATNQKCVDAPLWLETAPHTTLR